MLRRTMETVAEDGKDVVLLGVGRTQSKIACIDKNDFDFLLRLGISGNWSCAPNKDYVLCNSANGESRLVVARVLLDAGVGQCVRYRDGNPLNLRRSNLTLEPSNYGTRRDRDFIPKPKNNNNKEAA